MRDESTETNEEITGSPQVAEVLIGRAENGEPVVLSASERLGEWIGRPLDRVKGLPLSSMVGDGIPGLLTAVGEAMAGKEPEDLQFRFTEAGGAEQEVTLKVYRPEAFVRQGLSEVVVLRLEKASGGAATDAVLPYSAFHGLVGQSASMLAVFRKIRSYAPTDASVIITGETGTGKELVARALHTESERTAEPFIAVNCTAISRELLESELFGHERGSFTGAVRTHRGRFERASGGTLFLDEVGDMPGTTQAKLLRVLQEKKIERVGGDRAIAVDVRIVSATNLPLEQAVAEGRFREDLFHRLSVLRIHLPPLRQRGDDLAQIVQSLLEGFNRKYGRRVVRLSPGALELLYQYHWPGNVRELGNVVERVFIETHANVIGRKALQEWVVERQSLAPGRWNLDTLEARKADTPPILMPQGFSPPLLPAPEAVHRNARPGDIGEEEIREAFQAAGGNIAAASRKLGIHKATFYRRLKTLGLTREDLSAS